MIMIKGCRSSFLLTASFMGSKTNLDFQFRGWATIQGEEDVKRDFCHIEIPDPWDDLF